MTLQPHLNLLFLLFAAASATSTSTTDTAADTCAAYPISDGGESCGISDNFRPERKETYDVGGPIIDISHRISPYLPSFNSDKGLGEFVWLVKSQKNGSICNGSKFKLPIHTGTHVDFPAHFYHDYLVAGFDADDLDVLDEMWGEPTGLPEGHKGLRRWWEGTWDGSRH